jgi:hypothetical protein
MMQNIKSKAIESNENSRTIVVEETKNISDGELNSLKNLSI